MRADAAKRHEAARPRIVIIGGGFGGLACARALGGSSIQVTLIDKRNHNLFQPLLYQVATAALSPADIAEPIRKTLRRYSNVQVLLAEVTGIEPTRRLVLCQDGQAYPYDRLVIATGSDYNYFGHENWRAAAPGLKSLNEARAIRNRLLLAFEEAELPAEPVRRRALLTSVIVGGGPTGVEMAGAIVELAQQMAERDFRNLKASDVTVMLVEAGPRLLTAFPEKLARYAEKRLLKAGVVVRLNTKVEEITDAGVTIDGRLVEASCIVWGAGVKASPAGRWLDAPTDRSGRLLTGPDLRVQGWNEVYAIGDTAADAEHPLPALAQVAKQQGHYLGRTLRRELTDGPASGPFRFRDRGNTAVIARNAAVFDFGRWQLKGWFAWVLWAIVHVFLLVSFEKKLLVAIQWLWRYATRQRGARIIEERVNL